LSKGGQGDFAKSSKIPLNPPFKKGDLSLCTSHPVARNLALRLKLTDHVATLGIARGHPLRPLLSLLGNSGFPGLRLAVKMHYGDDQQGILPGLIDDSIGKAFCPAAPCSL